MIEEEEEFQEPIDHSWDGMDPNYECYDEVKQQPDRGQ